VLLLLVGCVTHKKGDTGDGNISDNFHENSFLQNGCCKVSNHMLSIMV